MELDRCQYGNERNHQGLPGRWSRLPILKGWVRSPSRCRLSHEQNPKDASYEAAQQNTYRIRHDRVSYFLAQKPSGHGPSKYADRSAEQEQK